MALPKIEVLPDPPALAKAAAQRIVALCRETLAEKETFAIGLAGGSTPKLTYELLASDKFLRRIEWPRVEVFFGDERCVPPDHPDSNYAMARRALLDHVPIPGDNVYRMKGELEPEQAAREYGLMLKDRFGDDEIIAAVREHGPEGAVTSRFNDGRLDLLLLGMGEDCHTLSLFPRTAALQEKKHRCVANFVQKLDGGKGAWRITLTAPFANRSAHLMALVAGAGKAPAVRELLEGDADPLDCPMKLIDPAEGRFAMLLDAAAAGMG